MECRDARPLITRLSTLAEAERTRLGQHLHHCAACRDEVEDPFVLPSRLPLAIPPPGIETRILSRLPAPSPVTLAARRHRTVGILRGSLLAAIVLTIGAGLAGLAGLQLTTARAADLVQGVAIPLALASKALLITLAQPWLILVLALGALLVPSILRWIRSASALPRRRGPVIAGGALLTAMLLLNAAGARGDIGTLTKPLDVSGPVAGDVTSFGGDIVIRGDVTGDVVALAGRVELAAGSHVHGSVLAGGGTTTSPDVLVDQHVYTTPRNLPALALASGTNSGVTLTPGAIARLGGMLAAVVTLLLGVLLVVVRPDAAAWGSRQLVHFPARALALGVLASSGLVVLALGGSVVLAATVAGVLLVPILLLMLHLPYVAGVATIGYTLGHRLTGSPANTSAIWGMGIQLLAVLALGLTVPMAGLFLFYLLGTAGLGGTLLGWQTRVDAF